VCVCVCEKEREREMDREMSNSHREREREREDANVVHTPPKYNKERNKSHQHSPSAYFSRYVIAPSIVLLNRFEKLFSTF